MTALNPPHPEEPSEAMRLEGRGGPFDPLHVMPGLVPGIHALLVAAKAWMAGTSPAMTADGCGK
jgi:hypothetical protein